MSHGYQPKDDMFFPDLHIVHAVARHVYHLHLKVGEGHMDAFG